MRKTPGAMLVVAMLLGGALAGCIGGKDEAVDKNDGDAIDPATTKPEGQQDGLGWIYGNVTDLQTGEPVADVNVSLGQELGSALTDDDGRFVIANVPRGEYILSAKAPSEYLLSRYAIAVFADEGTEMIFKLQPESAVGFEDVEPVVWRKLYLKNTDGADFMGTPGELTTEAPSGEAASNEYGHPQHGGFGVTSLPTAPVGGGRPAARMVWETTFDEAETLHADSENPVEFPDPSYPGGDVALVRYSAMKLQFWNWKPDSAFLWSVKVEDVAPDGSAELIAMRSEFVGGGSGDAGPGLLDLEMPFLKRGKEFHTFGPGHKLRITWDDSTAWWVVYFFDGTDYPASIDLRKGPYLEPPKAGDRIVLTFEGHTMAGASNPYGIAWRVPVPQEADPVINPIGIHRTGAGGYYMATACPDQTSNTCVGDATVHFDVPQGAQTVYTRLDFTEPPVREPSALLNDYDILLYEPSGKAHTHTAGYGGNQAELQFHDVFETPEWPQKWWVEIFAFLVVESDWTCTVEIVF